MRLKTRTARRRVQRTANWQRKHCVVAEIVCVGLTRNLNRTSSKHADSQCTHCNGCECAVGFGELSDAERTLLREQYNYDIVFNGGNLVAVDGILRATVIEHLARDLPQCKVHIPEVEAAVGAAFIARQLVVGADQK